MKTSAQIAFVSILFAASCGGTPEPPPEAATQRETPAPQAAPQQSVDVPTSAAEEPRPSGSSDTPAARTPSVPPSPAAPLPPARPAYTRTDLQVGTGRQTQKGKGISVHYTGWIYDPSKPEMKGRMFDSSRERGPFDFVLGAGQVIPGWDQGFDGMKIGGRRRLIIPPTLGYGEEGAGDGIIPPNATLIFEMELLDVQH